MGSLFSLFNKKSSRTQSPEPHSGPSRVTEQDRAVLQLKQQRDKLKMYQKKINARLESDREVARALLKEGRKEKARLLLRKKKYQEGLLAQTDSQLDNIEQMVHDIEFTQIESQVVAGLKQGNESLKRMQALMSLEDVESLMDETAEAVEFQRQVSDLLAGGALNETEEDEVLAELESLTAGETDDVTAALPNVPSGDLEAEEPKKERSKAQEDRPQKEAVLA